MQAVNLSIQLFCLRVHFPSHAVYLGVHFTLEAVDLGVKLVEFAVVYQPVVTLPGGELHGYEALTRGPAGSYFASPRRPFDSAQEADLLYPLEKATRAKALRALDKFSRQRKLFLNIQPQILNDPDFSGERTMEFLDRFDLNPESVVFEMTEGTAIRDFPTFRRALDHYRG